MKYPKTKIIFSLLAASILTAPFNNVGATEGYDRLQNPFNVGTTAYICQGYENSVGSHKGTSSISIDLTGGPGCDSSANGWNVRAPLSGTVAWATEPSGSICIANPDGRSVMLTHINYTVRQGDTVSAGKIVGKVAAPGQKQNANVSHLHLQAWNRSEGSNCTNDSYRVPFQASSGMQICGALNMTIKGPALPNSGTWSGSIINSVKCPEDAPLDSSPVYRFYSQSLQRHLFTSDDYEVYMLRLNGNAWKYEGISMYADNKRPCVGSQPVYRLYSDQLKTHLYTMDEYEKDQIVAKFPPSVWRYEGIAYCAGKSASAEGSQPVYRLYSDQLKTHLYTMDEYEKDQIVAKFPPSVWRYEGIAYYSYLK